MMDLIFGKVIVYDRLFGNSGHHFNLANICISWLSDGESCGDAREGVEGASTCLSSRSYNSMHSLHATGPDPYDKLKYKPGKYRVMIHFLIA